MSKRKLKTGDLFRINFSDIFTLNDLLCHKCENDYLNHPYIDSYDLISDDSNYLIATVIDITQNVAPGYPYLGCCKIQDDCEVYDSYTNILIMLNNTLYVIAIVESDFKDFSLDHKIC